MTINSILRDRNKDFEVAVREYLTNSRRRYRRILSCGDKKFSLGKTLELINKSADWSVNAAKKRRYKYESTRGRELGC